MASEDGPPAAVLEQQQPTLVPVTKPLSLIPVGLKEAALDSPTFRATVLHYSEQVDLVERWLEGIVKHASRLSQEASVLDSLMSSFFAHSAPPSHFSEAALDHDYSLRALKSYNEGAKTFMSQTTMALRGLQNFLVDPIREFLNNQVRPYREAKKAMDQLQRNLDNALSRYQAQGKNKEPSSLREDAFQLYEARRAYLKASMDVCVLGPQLRLSLDTLIIKVFSDQWLKIAEIRDGNIDATRKLSREMNRIRSWGRDLAANERVLRRELLMARKEMEESTLAASKPSRDLESYSTSTVPYRPAAGGAGEKNSGSNNKQGWLLQRIVAGRPARHVWVRRWYFVRNGIFGYLLPNEATGAVEESEKIGVLLCGVYAVAKEERRFCFEVKTTDSGFLLQAETQEEMSEWIAVFERAKQQAIEEPGTTELLANSGTDAAFAISPAVAPEFAVKSQERDTDDLEPEPGHLQQRPPADVTPGKKGAADKEDSGSRDHAAKIIQKLDLHRKATATAQVSKGNIQPPGGGIASLISASHGTILGPAAATPPARTLNQGRIGSISLAPDTLVMPPAPTGLSKTAVMIGMEKPTALQPPAAANGGLPGGLLANHWGATNYGYITRLERGEIGSNSDDKKVLTPLEERERRSSDPANPNEGSSLLTEEPESLTAGDVLSRAKMDEKSTSTPPRHRKTISVQEQTAISRGRSQSLDYPLTYPLPLRAHDVQFRLLFPDVAPDERVVLVARVSWSLNETQDLPGRAYITTKGIYFYSHHLGLVLVVGFELESIMDVSTSAYQDYDVLNITIRPKSEKDDPTLLSVKSFLEPIRLLKRRIDYLIDNASSEESESLDHIIQRLLSFESLQFQGPNGGPRSTVWDDLDGDEYFRDNEVGQTRREVAVKVDRNPFGGEAVSPDLEPARFRLPAHAINYTPTQVTHQAVERTFHVSAKALFHIMFGDQSALYQLLYRARRAKNITQTPWEMDNVFHRTFTYTVDTTDSFERPRALEVIDTQAIELSNDHLCYVVTDSRTPWHLPYSDQFRLLSKVVITHHAKSRSRLAIWTNVVWKRPPALSRKMIERHAFDDLHIDAVDTAELVADQVSRLGPGFTTKKAVQVFGHIGRQTHSASIVAADDDALIPRAPRINFTKQTLVSLIADSTRSLLISATSTVLMSLIGIGRILLKICSAHSILVALLASILLLQLLSGSVLVREWWRDRAAARFMASVGVRPDAHMARAVFLKDIPAAFSADLGPDSAWAASRAANQSICAASFAALVAETDPAFNTGMWSPRAPLNASAAAGGEDAASAQQQQQQHYPHPLYATGSTAATARRLGTHRLRLATQRHDLLVALRLVNRVEEQTLRAEWENWLLDEGVRCLQVGRVLRGSSSSSAAAAAAAEEHPGKKEKREMLRQWYAEYCESCQRERERLGIVGLG